MLKSVKVSDHMLRKPVVAKADTELFQAIHQILSHKISGVTVIDDHRHPIGILSELDALRAILSAIYYQEDIGTHIVGDHMSFPVESVSPTDDIIDVAQSMLDHKRRRRPVVDAHGELIGQLTCRQLLKAIKDMDHPEVRSER
jgi:CBS domain-containing protein